MHTHVVYFIIGLIVGYFIMMSLNNTVHYHGMDSKKVRNTYFVYGDKKIRFVPKIINNEIK